MHGQCRSTESSLKFHWHFNGTSMGVHWISIEMPMELQWALGGPALAVHFSTMLVLWYCYINICISTSLYHSHCYYHHSHLDVLNILTSGSWLELELAGAGAGWSYSLLARPEALGMAPVLALQSLIPPGKLQVLAMTDTQFKAQSAALVLARKHCNPERLCPDLAVRVKIRT